MKFIDPNIRFGANGTRTHRAARRPYIRMAELYLNLAECYAALENTTEALANLNEIRGRAGLKELTDADLTGDMTLMDWVRNERFVELYEEGFRYYDVRRWMIAEQEGVMSGAMYGIKIYWINSSPQEFRYTPYLYENRTFTKKMYLHPFSTNEVNKGYLIQNPGY